MTTKSVEAVRDTILQFNHEHEGWPAPERVMAGGFDECLDCAESLARRCMAAHSAFIREEAERKDVADAASRLGDVPIWEKFHAMLDQIERTPDEG